MIIHTNVTVPTTLQKVKNKKITKQPEVEVKKEEVIAPKVQVTSKKKKVAAPVEPVVETPAADEWLFDD